jgi:uncharacterized protein (TIGR02271 family)
MISQDQLRNVIGAVAYDRDGDKIGKVGQVYFDDETDQPKWVTVNTGFFGTSENFVPVQGAELSGDRVTLAYDKAKVKDAPKIAEDGHLSPQEEEQLYRYYGLGYGGGSEYATGGTDTVTTGTAAGVAAGLTDRDRRTDLDRDGRADYDETRGTRGRDTSGPTTDDAMTRSEEKLRVGTETQAVGKARLRKHVVTEHEQVTVPVSREEVTVEREPITEANRGAAYDGPAISEEEHEVTLHAERPVVDTEAVAVERVKLGTQTVTEQETVGGEVRKEQIEVDDDGVRDRDLTDRDRTDRDVRR